LDLPDPGSLSLGTDLLFTAFGDAFDLKAQAGILAVNGAQNLPLRERLSELASLLQQAGLANDRFN